MYILQVPYVKRTCRANLSQKTLRNYALAVSNREVKSEHDYAV